MHTAVHTAVSGAADTGVQTNRLSLSQTYYLWPLLCACGYVALKLRPGAHSLDDEKGHLYENAPDLSARLVSESQLHPTPSEMLASHSAHWDALAAGGARTHVHTL